MLSSTASPVKRQSVAIPQSMQKLIAKLQCPKKISRKSVSDPLQLEYGKLKKIKLSPTITESITPLKNTGNAEVSTVEKIVSLNDDSFITSTKSSCSIGRKSVSDRLQLEYGKSKKIKLSPTITESMTPLKNTGNAEVSTVEKIVSLNDDSFITSTKSSCSIIEVNENVNSPIKERPVFIYPKIEAVSKCDDLIVSFESSSVINSSTSVDKNVLLPTLEKKTTIGIETSEVDKSTTRTCFVTLNDVLHNTTQGSFVDELYDDSNDDGERQVCGQSPEYKLENILPQRTEGMQLQPEPVDDLLQELHNAIEQIRNLNNFITSANEEIFKLNPALHDDKS